MSPGVPFNGTHKKKFFIEWSTKWMMLVVRQIRKHNTNSEQFYLWCIRNVSKNIEQVRKNGKRKKSIEYCVHVWSTSNCHMQNFCKQHLNRSTQLCQLFTCHFKQTQSIHTLIGLNMLQTKLISLVVQTLFSLYSTEWIHYTKRSTYISVRLGWVYVFAFKNNNNWYSKRNKVVLCRSLSKFDKQQEHVLDQVFLEQFLTSQCGIVFYLLFGLCWCFICSAIAFNSFSMFVLLCFY